MSDVIISGGPSRRDRTRRSEDILKSLTLTMRSRSLYPDDHPLLRRSAEKAAQLFKEYTSEEGAWSIALIGGEFIHERVPLSRLTAQVTPLIRTFSNRQIQSVTVRAGVSAEELLAFFQLILSPHEIWTHGGDPTPVLVEADIRNIFIQRLDMAKGGALVSTDTEEARDIYASLKHALKTFALSLVDGRRTVSLDLINQLRDRLIVAMETDTFAIASRLHTRHAPDDLFAHSINTAIIAYMAAKAIGLPGMMMRDIVLAGLLHDIGLMDIPPRFNDGYVVMSEDGRIYLEHPIRGLGILRSIPGVPLLAEIAVFEHHRQHNGEGFPRFEDDKAVGAAAQIIGMASHYDTFMHGAAYTPPEDIPMRMIKMAGTEFEPRMLAHFLVAVGMYPPGTYVKLTTNEVALVVDVSRGDVFRPAVKILRDGEGRNVADGKQIDLTERDTETGGYYASIVGSISQLN